MVVNATEVTSRGIEAKFMWNPVERVWCDFQVGCTDATFEDHRDASGARVDGRAWAREAGASALAIPPRGRSCEAASGAELVLLGRVSVPAAQQRRLQTALRFLAEDSLVPDPARVHVAAAASPQKDVLHVGIVDRDQLAQALGRLGRSGITPVAADPGTLRPPLEPRAWGVGCNSGGTFLPTRELEWGALASAAGGQSPVGLRLKLRNSVPST